MNVLLLTDNIFEKFLSQLITSSLQYCISQSLEAPFHLFSRYLTTSIEINGFRGRGSYETGIEEFIKQKCEQTLNHFRLTPGRSHFSKPDYLLGYGRRGWGTKRIVEETEETWDIEYHLTPISNDLRVFFWYKGTFIRVTNNIQATNASTNASTNADRHFGDTVNTETIKITAYFTRNKNVLVDMLNEARKIAEEKRENCVDYYRADAGDLNWHLARRIHPRALSSIILRDGVTNAIQNDIENFLENRQWYKERGIPYRRGYLLYGPPGCGKTSFVKAISGQIGYNIYEAQLSDRNLNDQVLNILLSRFGRKSILLLEDIDAVFVTKPQDEDEEMKQIYRQSMFGVTFSGLLNAIDGVASEEDYIIFMTTNHIDKLDAALIRPGRIDLKQLIDYPDEKQIATYFEKFYPDCEEELPLKFAKAVKDLKRNVSVAQIQGIFLKHKDEPEETLFDLESLVEVNNKVEVNNEIEVNNNDVN